MENQRTALLHPLVEGVVVLLNRKGGEVLHIMGYQGKRVQNNNNNKKSSIKI